MSAETRSLQFGDSGILTTKADAKRSSRALSRIGLTTLIVNTKPSGLRGVSGDGVL